MQLRSLVAVAVAVDAAGGCGSNLTPGLGTSISHRRSHKKKKRKCSFYVGAERESIPTGSNVIQEKAKSLSHNLKQRKVKDLKMEDLIAAKDGLRIL